MKPVKALLQVILSPTVLLVLLHESLYINMPIQTILILWNIFIKIILTAPSRRPRAPAERAFLFFWAAFGKKILGFSSSLFLPLLGRKPSFVFLRTVTKKCSTEICLNVNNYHWSARTSLFKKRFWIFFIFCCTGESLRIYFEENLWECLFFIFCFLKNVFPLYSLTQEILYIL